MKRSLGWILEPLTAMAADILPQQALPFRLIEGTGVSQLGFQPREPKFGVLLLDTAPAPTGKFALETSAGVKVLEGALIEWGKSWGRKAWQLDFSKFTKAGVYRLRVGDRISRTVPKPCLSTRTPAAAP